jgi:hypothetical protein
VLRIIIRSKRDEVTGGWRKLHNEEIHIQIKGMSWAGHAARIGKKFVLNFGWKAQMEETILKTRSR